MDNKIYYYTQDEIKPKSKIFEYLIILLMFCSFLILGAFRAFEHGYQIGGVSVGDSASSAFWSYAVYLAIISWIIFELVMRLYYFFVSLSVYVFVVPKKDAYCTFRAFYALRNVFVAGLGFLLFISPIWVNFYPVVVVLIDFIMLFFVFLWFKKKYLGVLLAPFAWKALLRPFIIYEFVLLIFNIGGLVL